jgi:D-alanyl-D-alanine carboxypeptidase
VAVSSLVVLSTVINQRPVALVVMDAFGKYTHFADASRLRTWIETYHQRHRALINHRAHNQAVAGGVGKAGFGQLNIPVINIR